ncbi:MAG: hypothetical protein OXI77_01590 [Chloroflexota bacterium]|nr:hypothetical protein [Chloroflexota bacterium]MDE2910738.1 hypothetical protein [Chloroflexota bacterium]
MDKTYSHLIIHVITWVCLSILLPLLPIGLGILIARLQVVEVSFIELLNGIELLLISLGQVTATGIDISQANIDRSARPLAFFCIRLLLILLGIGSIILLTLIYVDENVTNMKFDTATKFSFVGILAVSVSLVTVVLQLYIGYIRYRRSIEDSGS